MDAPPAALIVRFISEYKSRFGVEPICPVLTAAAGASGSVGTVGDAYHVNALAESVIGLLTTELIRPRALAHRGSQTLFGWKDPTPLGSCST